MSQRKHFEIIVIGSGLSGLTTGFDLISKGHDVLILESLDIAGGHSRGVRNGYGVRDNGLKFLPNTAASKQAVDYLYRLTGVEGQFQITENHPITFEGGELKPFVGFGDRAPAFYKQIDYFLSPERLELSQPLNAFVSDLIAKLSPNIMTRSIVTKLVCEGDRVTGVVINGTKTITADKFIFAGHPKELVNLLPEEKIQSRVRQKIAKHNYWTAICIDILHGQHVSDRREMHLLNGTTQDEIGPCVGLFHKAEETQGLPIQFSQWLTYLDRESCEDTEAIGAALKKIKRQVKRAYPTAFDSVVFERIVVAPLIDGEIELKVNANQTLPTASNLWLASSMFNHQANLVGALNQAELIVESIQAAIQTPSDLGFSPEPAI